MENLFSTVLRMSATGALVILAVLLARLALRRAPRVFSYALWAVVLFRLLCPLTIESAFSLLPSARVVDVPNPEQGVSQVIQVDTGISAVDRPVNDFFIQHPYQGQPVLPKEDVSVPPSVSEPTPAPPIQQSGPVSDWRTVPAMVWLAGVGLLLAYSLISLLRLRRRLVGWVPLEGEKNVRLADHIPSPFVLGVFRPKIYLPSGLLSEERDYILLHERTHIRRLDHILRALAWLALAVHWFNPLVWLAFHLAGRDMEMSCDEAVLQKMGRDIRADYSSSLLRLSVGGRLPAGPLAFGSGDPQGRIKNVLNYKKPALWVMVAALIAVLCAGAALATNQISPLIDPNSVISVTSFDASSRTITPQNTGVYTTADLRKDLLNPVNPQVLSRESGIELVRLINSHRKTVYGHGELTLNGWEHHLKRIDCADGSFYVMDYWYWNGFSFSPFHMGEDDYTTLVTYFDAEGNPGTTWQMEYNFDLAYWNLRYDIGQTNKVVNSVPADLSLTLDQLDDGVPFVRISGTADGIPLERTSWNPPEWFAQFGSESAAIYPLGKLWFEVPLCDNEVICALDACWTDESRSAVKVTATPRAMISSYSIAGNLIFTVNLSKDGGTLAELDGYVPKLAAGAPELVPTEAEAVRAGLIAARLLTAAENFYDESMAALAEKQGDGLTFSLGAHGSYVRLSGSVDGLPVSSAASWQPDSIFDVDVLGNLFIPYPPFGEEEDGMVYAWWENEDRTAVTITGQPLALSTSGRDYTGWLTFTIALGKDGSAAYQSSYVKGTEENVYLASLSEEEMIAFGRYAAKLLTAAEDYYNNCMTGGSANERSYVLSHEEDGETVVVIQGLGAYLEWMAPNPIFSGGWLYFGGDPTFCCPALAGEEIDGNAMWTDEGALSVAFATKTDGHYFGFAANLDIGAVSRQDIPYYEAGPLLELTDSELMDMARVLAECLTGAENYYKQHQPPVSQAPAPEPVSLDGLTFSDGWNNTVSLGGLDCGELSWYSDGMGSLYFSGPAFLGPFFEKRPLLSGNAYWDDLRHTTIRVNWGGDDHPYGGFLVELPTGQVKREGVTGELSDAELTAIAQTFDRLMQAAEEYRTDPASHPAEEGPLPFDRAMELSFHSGAGAWQTYLRLHPDGSFEGEYSDMDMGDGGSGYQSTEYVCQFHGRFGNIRRVTNASYSMVLEELVIDTGHPIGEQWIESTPYSDGTFYRLRRISSAPYGLSTRDGEDNSIPLEPGAPFMLYTPDASGKRGGELHGMENESSDLFEFWTWWPQRHAISGGSGGTLGRYGLHNITAGYGFFS